MKAASTRCQYCLGVITAPKRCSMERTVAIHIDNCPAAHRGRKPAKLTEPEPEPVVPRKRIIPRQVL